MLKGNPPNHAKIIYAKIPAKIIFVAEITIYAVVT